MKIYFGTTSHSWDKYKENYFAIRDYLKELGHILLFDWIDDVDKTLKFKKPNERNRNIEMVYSQIMNGIDDSDAVIIEFSMQSFSSSHQITYALAKKKSVLVLRNNEESKDWGNSYFDAIKSPQLHVESYTLDTYKDVIDEFLGYQSLENTPQRYNIVLGKKQKQFLDWASVEYTKSKSEIIRELIDELVAKDGKYKKYMKF